MSAEAIDIGSGFSYSWYVDGSGERAGIILKGPCEGGSIPTKAWRDGPVWTVEQEDPLTLSPSILEHPHTWVNENDETINCPGFHGFIRNGRWEGC